MNPSMNDAKKLPKDAVWRFRKEGDIIEKFGGGTKKLKSFLIDKKIPSRERDILPVLALGNEVFVIAGVEISEKVKVDANGALQMTNRDNGTLFDSFFLESSFFENNIVRRREENEQNQNQICTKSNRTYARRKFKNRFVCLFNCQA